jgi:hypothetical protein
MRREIKAPPRKKKGLKAGKIFKSIIPIVIFGAGGRNRTDMTARVGGF